MGIAFLGGFVGFRNVYISSLLGLSKSPSASLVPSLPLTFPSPEVQEFLLRFDLGPPGGFDDAGASADASDDEEQEGAVEFVGQKVAEVSLGKEKEMGGLDGQFSGFQVVLNLTMHSYKVQYKVPYRWETINMIRSVRRVVSNCEGCNQCFD